MQEITFITSHPLKAQQLGRHLNVPVRHRKLDLEEIQSLDVCEVVKHKALAAYAQVGKPVLVEDISFQFLALGKLPGPLIKWFLKELNVEGLCRLIDAYDNREVVAQAAFAFADGKDVHVFLGEMSGRIADRPRGESGFGIDSLFIPEGWDKTWGEMTDEEQMQSSVRRLALKKLEKFLSDN